MSFENRTAECRIMNVESTVRSFDIQHAAVRFLTFKKAPSIKVPTAFAEAGGRRNSAIESTTMNPTTFQIRRIDAADTQPLRHAILRPNQPFEATVYPLDEEPASGHFGAFLGDELVGVDSVFNETRPGEINRYAWRLRGMATREQDRGQGIGGALLRLPLPPRRKQHHPLVQRPHDGCRVL